MLLPLQAGCSKLASKARPFLLHYKLLKRAAKKTQALMRGDASRVISSRAAFPQIGMRTPPNILQQQRNR